MLSSRLLLRQIGLRVSAATVTGGAVILPMEMGDDRRKAFALFGLAIGGKTHGGACPKARFWMQPLEECRGGGVL